MEVVSISNLVSLETKKTQKQENNFNNNSL